MINKKILLHGSKETQPMRITIEYEWNDDNDKLIEKIIENLPNFIEEQRREYGRTKKVFNR